ncbi:YadA-like family protein [Sneathia vaginalis]|uniref:YadA-like family protein n=1 Tax=Sneathia vaginalis TaxID=187101 RepID=UPI00259B5CFB|nr:YadA-like family protein [uncultured Sneathia sp.]
MKKNYLGKIIFILSIIQSGIVLASDIKNEMGDDAHVYGKNSYAIGTKVRTIGDNSITIGVNSISKGDGIYSIGESNRVFGNGNLVLGNRNKVYNTSDDFKKSLKSGKYIKIKIHFYEPIPSEYGNTKGREFGPFNVPVVVGEKLSDVFKKIEKRIHYSNYKLIATKYDSNKEISEDMGNKTLECEWVQKETEIDNPFSPMSGGGKKTPQYVPSADKNGNILHGSDNTIYGETNTVLGNNNNLGVVIPTYDEWKGIDENKNKSENDYTAYLNEKYKYNEWLNKNSGKTLQDFIKQIYVKNNIILGSNIINTDVNNAIVIGNGSKAIENAVSIGNDTTTRQIKYVKAGTDDTDAVNVSQLKEYVKANSFSAENYYNKAEVDKKLEGINVKSNLALSGVANAIAMSSMTQPREGLLNITGAYGTYGGEHALAVGISGNTERFSYKLGVSTNMRGNVGVGLGFGMTVVSSTKDEKMKRMQNIITNQESRIKYLEEQMKKIMKK